ncbi:hypothetical protein [Streptomyces sp. NPDC047108]|uniref:hypothetical protein n=1 Tax=Streptomyces sp. NPDC047108 TaxID=3155025 RepID=UPI0033E52E55
MSPGGDDYGHDYPGEVRDAGGGTRTHLPEGAADGPYGAVRRARGAGRPSRSMITIVGVVVLLIAAIAFANRGGGDGGDSGSGSGGDGAKAQPTAPTGEKPVAGSDAGIASGFPKTEQGAQSAAANYAVALVSADILKPDRRPDIVQRLFVSDRVDELGAKLDRAYSRDFLDKLGLDDNGNAEQGMTYISRTTPVGTKVTEHSDASATVEVWCTGVFGTAGVSSTNPVANDWFTMTLELRWDGGDWKVDGFSQKDGPAPVNSDRRASDADEISKAVEEYGGFTYAR